MEEACAPKLNTGMFAAMKESGDVMGIFVGHDHDNDYAVMWKGILLAYGRSQAEIQNTITCRTVPVSSCLMKAPHVHFLDSSEDGIIDKVD